MRPLGPPVPFDPRPKSDASRFSTAPGDKPCPSTSAVVLTPVLVRAPAGNGPRGRTAPEKTGLRAPMTGAAGHEASTTGEPWGPLTRPFLPPAPPTPTAPPPRAPRPARGRPAHRGLPADAPRPEPRGRPACPRTGRSRRAAPAARRAPEPRAAPVDRALRAVPSAPAVRSSPGPRPGRRPRPPRARAGSGPPA